MEVIIVDVGTTTVGAGSAADATGGGEQAARKSIRSTKACFLIKGIIAFSEATLLWRSSLTFAGYPV